LAEIHHPLDQPAIVGFRDGLTGNRHILPAIAACIPLRIAYTHTPAMQAGFDSTSLTLLEWGRVLAAGLLAFSVAELQKLVVRRTRLAAYVLDPAASPDQALAWIRGASDEQLLQVARQRLAHDLAAANVPATLRLVRSKDATAVIRETAASTQSGLAASPRPRVCVGIEETESAAFLAATALPEGMKVRPVVECGAIESTLTRYVREHGIDLVVMGSHGRSGLMSLLPGSTATKLLDWLPCDTLLVREPTARLNRETSK